MTPSLPAAVDQGVPPATTTGTRAAAPPAAASPAAAPPAAGPARALTGAGLAVLLLGFLPVNFTFGAVNLLVPAITADLDTGPSGGQLVLSAYTTTFAAGLVVSGRLGDRYGRRRLFMIGLISFGVLAALTGLAQGLVDLVALRAALGLAAGLFTPQVLSTIQATAPAGLRARGIIMFTAASAVATIAGQVVAGADRRLAARGPGLARGPADHRRDRARWPCRGCGRSRSPGRTAPLGLDLPGAALLGGGLVALVVPLTIGPTAGWPAWSLGLLAAAAVTLAAFVLSPAAGRATRSAARGAAERAAGPGGADRPAHDDALLRHLRRVPVRDLGVLADRVGRRRVGTPRCSCSGSAGPSWSPRWCCPGSCGRVGPRIMVYAASGQAVVLLGIALVIGIDGGRSAPLVLQPLLVALGAVQAMMFGPALQTVLSRTPTGRRAWRAGCSPRCSSSGSGWASRCSAASSTRWPAPRADPAGGRRQRTPPARDGLAVGLVTALAVQAACAVVFALLAHRVARHSAAG